MMDAITQLWSDLTVYEIVAGVAVLAVLVWFALVAYRDLRTLVASRPIGDAHGPERRTHRLARGIGRVWAIARLTIREAWWAKAWAVPLVWLAVVVIINIFVRPFDPQERMRLYLQVMLTSQEWMALILLGVMACFSLPRERERRTIITTGAKPISRLELFLGKVTGFSVVGAFLLLTMGAISYGYAYMTDARIRTEATEKYAKQVEDFQNRVEGVGPPSEALRMTGEQGVLRAENYVTAANMQVAGWINYKTTPPERYLKGGSAQKAIYRFPGGVYAVPNAAQHQMPVINFMFPVRVARPVPPPEEIRLRVQFSRINRQMQGAIIEKTIVLVPSPQIPGNYTWSWRPDPVHMTEIVSVRDQRDWGAVDLAVQCDTPGVYLQIGDRPSEGAFNVWFEQVDPAVHGNDRITYPQPPHMLGFEKRNLQQIEGPQEGEDALQAEVASWRFKAEDLQDVPIDDQGTPDDPKDDTFDVAMVLDIEKTDNNTLVTRALVRAYSPFSASPLGIPVTVFEKQLTPVTLPATLLSRNANTGKVDADLFIDLQCATPGHWIGANTSSVRLAQQNSPFLLNLVKSELVLLCEVILLVTIAVAASVRLGGAVAMLVTVTGYLLGNLFSFVQSQVFEGSYSLLTQVDAADTAGNVLYKVVNVLQGASLKLVFLFVNLLPDFRRFQPQEFILDARNMPWATLGSDLLWTAIYLVPLIALGYLLLRKQELA